MQFIKLTGVKGQTFAINPFYIILIERYSGAYDLPCSCSTIRLVSGGWIDVKGSETEILNLIKQAEQTTSYQIK
jgi:uncharacterized protein YlzI (FlbEa/FlbD family)